MKHSVSIDRPVGEGETNRSSDLEAVRNALAERGFCRRSITGQWNAKYKQDLTAGIRLFQRQSGLQPDGIVIPGGPTAHALALGGELAAVPALSEGKQRSAACVTLERQIDDVQSQIRDSQRGEVNLKRELDGLRRQRDRLKARLEGMLGGLGLGFVPSDENLAGLIRDLENVPEEFRLEAQRAASSTRELIKLVDRINDLNTRLLARQATLAILSRTISRLLAQHPVVCGV